jgi:hypothetical protein
MVSEVKVEKKLEETKVLCLMFYIDVHILHKNRLTVKQRGSVLNVVYNLKIITYISVSTFFTRRTILRVGYLENIYVDSVTLYDIHLPVCDMHSHCASLRS